MREIRLSGSCLKVITMTAMVIDHIALYFVSNGWLYESMRGIGRIAFPILLFSLRKVISILTKMGIWAESSDVCLHLGNPLDVASYRWIA